MQHCILYLYIIFRDDQIPNTSLDVKLQVGEIEETAEKPRIRCGSGF